MPAIGASTTAGSTVSAPRRSGAGPVAGGDGRSRTLLLTTSRVGGEPAHPPRWFPQGPPPGPPCGRVAPSGCGVEHAQVRVSGQDGEVAVPVEHRDAVPKCDGRDEAVVERPGRLTCSPARAVQR